MTAHPSDRRLHEYRRAQLPPEEQLDVDDHLAACERCRLQLLDAEQLRSAVASLREGLETESVASPVHASYEDLASYTDGELDPIPRQALEEHLQVCEACAGEARELQALREIPEGFPGTDRAAAAPRPGRWHGRALPVAVAFAAAAALAIIAWLVPLQDRVKRLQAELDALQATTRSLRQESASLRAAAEGLESELQALQKESLGSPEPRSKVVLNDAMGVVSLDERGRLHGLEPLQASHEARVRWSLWTRRLRIPRAAAALLTSRPGRLRGSEPEPAFTLTSPCGIVVESDRPAFRWQPLTGASSYSVSVYDSRLQEVAVSPLITAAEWSPERPLPRGAFYVWQVTAYRNGRELTAPAAPEPEARFRILDAGRADELAQLRNTHRSHLLLAILYSEDGLLDQAEHELQALVALNPGSAVVQGLLATLRDVRPEGEKREPAS